MKLFVTMIVLFLFAAGGASGQLQIYKDGKPVLHMGVRHRFTESDDFTRLSRDFLAPEQWRMVDESVTRKGIYDQSLWIRIPLRALNTNIPLQLVSIENPHINFLKCWFVLGDSVVKETRITGDHLPFSSREIPTGGFSFTIPSVSEAERMELIIAADKRKTKLELPIYFSSVQHFAVRKQSEGVRTGFFLGFISLLLIIHIYLLYSTGDHAHAWYILFLLNITAYQLADRGLLFKILHPGVTRYNDLIRPVLISLCLLPILMFYRNLLRLDERMRRHDLVLKWLLSIFVVGVIISLMVPPTDDYAAQQSWLTLVSILSPSILIYFLWITVTATRKKIPLSGFAVVSVSGITLFTLLFSLAHNDILADDHLLFRNGQYAGMFLDGTVMTFALIARFLSFRRRNQELQQKIREQEELLFREVAQWQHREMNRISHFLHDSLGSSLALIRLETDYMELNEENRKKLSEKIEGVGADIRQMSHTFSTRLLEEKGLRCTLTEQIRQLNRIHSFDIRLEWIEEDQSIRFHYQMVVYLIVQELLRNFIRHAQTGKANLQILTADNRVYIYMEDEGIGASGTGNGIGLRHIRDLVELLKGTISIQTAAGEGFRVSIEFNQHSHEIPAHGDR
jgi:two-component system, sensor histidine kinase LadS